MSLAYSSAESRRAPRETVDCQTHIQGALCPPTDALIVNFSPYGCMIRCDRFVPIGSKLTMDMPGMGTSRVTVIWSLGSRLGLEFETCISLDHYLAMLPLMKASYDGKLLG